MSSAVPTCTCTQTAEWSRCISFGVREYHCTSLTRYLHMGLNGKHSAPKLSVQSDAIWGQTLGQMFSGDLLNLWRANHVRLHPRSPAIRLTV